MSDYATREDLNGLGRRVTELEKDHAGCQGALNVRVEKLESWTQGQEDKIDANDKEHREALADLKKDHSGRIDLVKQDHADLRVEVTKIPERVAKQVNGRMTITMSVAGGVIAIITLLVGIFTK